MTFKDMVAQVARVKPDTSKKSVEAWELQGFKLSMAVEESTDVAQAMIEEWTSEMVKYKQIKRRLDEKLRRDA